jgi:hypothetical protein
MANAEDLINSANEKVVDEAINADLAASQARAKALTMETIATLLPDKYPLNWDSLPKPGTIALSTAPSMTTATYDAPDKLGAAPDILGIMQAAYEAADAPSRSMVDNATLAFIAYACPDYANTLNELQSLLIEGANSIPISPADQAALMASLRNSLDNTRKAAQRKASSGLANGHEEPLFLYARMDQIDADFTDNMADGLISIITKVIDITLDMRKTCLGLMDQLNTSTRSAFLNYAGIIAGILDHRVRYATAAAQGAESGYGAEVKQQTALIEWGMSNLEAGIKTMEADLSRYTADLNAKVKTKELEYTGVDAEIRKQSVGFQGELQAHMQDARLYFEALSKGVQILSDIASVHGRIAEARASGVNAIASKSVVE